MRFHKREFFHVTERSCARMISCQALESVYSSLQGPMLDINSIPKRTQVLLPSSVLAQRRRRRQSRFRGHEVGTNRTYLGAVPPTFGVQPAHLTAEMATKARTGPSNGIPTAASFAIAGASGISAWMFVHPMDVLKVFICPLKYLCFRTHC